MALQETTRRSGAEQPVPEVAHEDYYYFQEVTPEEEAARSVEAVWATYGAEVQRALLKLTETA